MFGPCSAVFQNDRQPVLAVPRRLDEPRTEVGQAVHVELTVFDLLGRQVSSLVNEAQTAGEYSINFNGKGLASGVYFVRLTAGDFVESAKVILAK